MTFNARLTVAVSFEDQIASQLQAAGWTIERWGQGRWPKLLKHSLLNFQDTFGRPSLLRWLPDLLIARGAMICAVEVKSEMRCPPTENVAIELSSLETAEALVDRFYTPVFFVFESRPPQAAAPQSDVLGEWPSSPAAAPQSGVLTPRIIRQRGQQFHGPRTNGSNTPFLLVPKAFGMPFGDVFGHPIPTLDLS